jgi:hypothetical protein
MNALRALRKLCSDRRLPTLVGSVSVAMAVATAGTAAAKPVKSAKPAAAADKAGGKTAAAAKKTEGGAMPDAFAQTGSPTAGAESSASSPSFEDLLKDAVPVKDFATLIEPLYARCDDPEPLYKRQCEVSKSFLLDYLHSHTFVAESDIPPDTSPYDAAAKQVDMEISGCVVCKNPIMVAGEPRYLTTKPPQRVVEGRAQVDPLANHEIAIADRVRADRFVERVVPRLKVQHVFRFTTPYPAEAVTGSSPGQPSASGAGQAMALVGKTSGLPPIPPPAKGVLVASLGHRVYDRCTGQIAAAKPAALSPVKVSPDRGCPRDASEDMSQAEIKKQQDFMALPERLTPREIDRVLAPIQARVHECYVEFGEPSGNAKVSLVIGAEGKLTQITLPSPFDKADIAVCLRSQLRSAVFPKFRGSPMKLDYVYQVQ